MNEDKRQLIREFSNYFETVHNFAPLTSKVYAYLLLDCEKKGATFDELVETLNASKSSVSNSLSFLSQLKYIDYYTKLEDRKRLYRVVPDNIVLRLQNIQEMLFTEKELTRKLRDFRLNSGAKPNDIGILKSNIYLEHLDEVSGQLSKTIEKLKQLN